MKEIHKQIRTGNNVRGLIILQGCTKLFFFIHSSKEIQMSPKKKTALARGRKSGANRTNVKKRQKTVLEVVSLLQKLDQEDTSE